ncbi:MAG TPA: hypothetical protein VNE86_05770 [Nitrososphaerales archaeon]|nr:hypothetical protein [Nitrososphaerales archaeon]
MSEEKVSKIKEEGEKSIYTYIGSDELVTANPKTTDTTAKKSGKVSDQP